MLFLMTYSQKWCQSDTYSFWWILSDAEISQPVADRSNIRQPGKQPVPVLCGQQRPQLFGFDKVFYHDVQTPAVGGLWRHHLESHLKP